MRSFGKHLNSALARLVMEGATDFEQLLNYARRAYADPRLSPSDDSFYFPILMLADYLERYGPVEWANEIRNQVGQLEQRAVDRARFEMDRRLGPSELRALAQRRREAQADVKAGREPEYSNEELYPEPPADVVRLLSGQPEDRNAVLKLLARVGAALDPDMLQSRRSSNVPVGSRIPDIRPNDEVSWSADESNATLDLIGRSGGDVSTDGGVFTGRVVSTNWDCFGVRASGDYIDDFSPNLPVEPMDDDTVFRVSISSPQRFRGVSVLVPLGILRDPPFVDESQLDDLVNAWSRVDLMDPDVPYRV